MSGESVLTTELLDMLAVPAEQRGDVRFSGEGATFGEERYDVPRFAAACIAAAHTLGSGGQGIDIDVVEAAEAFRSERFLTVDGKEPASLWAPLSTDYQDRNGRWLRIHANFPNHAHAAASALRAEPDVDAFRATISSGDAFELEELVVAAGGAAAALRTRNEWHHHPQYDCLKSQPLVAFKELTDPTPIVQKRPLRVLDLTRVIAGPIASRVLALYGADVLAVTAESLPQIDPLVIETGFGKRSIFLNLRDGDDAATFRRLLKKTSEVCACSTRAWI